MARIDLMAAAMWQQASKADYLSEEDRRCAMRYFASKVFKKEDEEEQPDRRPAVRSRRDPGTGVSEKEAAK